MNQYSYKYDNPFTLESGEILPEVDIVYHTCGKLSPQRDNIIWVCHALTANSDVKDWWPGTVEEGKFLDPNRYFIICVNILGSCYGTTGPTSINKSTGEPYYGSFPKITIRDVVNVNRLIADHLEIDKVKLLIGSSVGGFQVSEWIIMDPQFAQKAVIIASASKAEAWVVAFNESQRMAIEADSTFGEPDANCAKKGLATARAIALLSYRGREAYNRTQSEVCDDKTCDYRAASYQQYQGKKLTGRFDAYTYYRLTQLIDSHNLARGRGSIEQVLSLIETDVQLIAISTDIIYPVASYADFNKYIKSSSLHIIESDFGHDGFLVEHGKLNGIITTFLDK